MNTEHTLTVLEFHELIESICGEAQSEPGIALIRALRPSSDLDVITRNRPLYSDMIAMRNKPLEPPSLRTDDLGEILRHVAPEGAVIDGTELISCLSLLDTAHDLKEFADGKDAQTFTVFQSIVANIDPCEPLRAILTRSIDRDGSVMDSASEKLRSLRREATALEYRIQRHLEQMVHSNENDSSLQDHFVTTRNGRYVIPVKRDARNNLPGIVHDLSNSGQTLFVEPTETLGWGNDLVRTRAEEHDEIIRILTDLSARLRSQLPAITANQRILAQLDAAHAIARWAGINNCELPEFSRHLKLENARHPLLQIQFRKEGKGRMVVPLNLDVPDHIKTIAITGSNTGGKTVVLKTVGLLSLAAQSGLPVTAGPGSKFRIFDNILADIGDEQSIQADLSTFSAHIVNISDIIRNCSKGNSLVLLDEIGGGTDPSEGSAIACGIIDALARQKTLSIATTHLALVKNYVHSRSDMLNASVRFDVKTLRPEYILDVGRPGASHALQIAKRLGLPDYVLATAKRMLSEDQIKLEQVLTKMEADQRKLAGHASRMEGAENEIIKKRDDLKKELEDLRTQRRQLIEEAHRQAEALVNNTRREMENLVRELREKAKNNSDAQPSPEALAEMRNALAEKERKIQAGLKIHAAKPKQPLAQEELAIGKRVWVEKMNAHGVIESISAKGSNVTLSINGLQVTVKTSELERNRDGVDRLPQETVVKIIRPRSTESLSSELNLIGMRSADAIDLLSEFIDRASLQRMPELRIVHGFGTGRLRLAVHEWLRTCPAVKDYHLGTEKEPGAGGCTIVHLNN